MTSSTRQQEVRTVLIITLVANLLVAIAKVVVGLITGSLAMTADGFHSSLDATSNVIGLVSSALAARPPDADHPYGHRRFETLASLFIGGVLLLTAWEIVKSAIGRLSSGGAPAVTLASFTTMIATLIVNIGVSVYERRAGKRLNSELLLADAENTTSDVFVSLTVLGSLVAVRLGWTWVDAASALVVVVLIGRAAWRVLSRSASILVDRAALDASAVSEVVRGVSGVQQVARVRSRGPADEVHLDLDVQVAAPTTADHSAAIAREVRARLRDAFSGLRDIQVHFLPGHDGPVDYALITRAEADALGLGVHEIIPTLNEHGLTLDMHVEVAPGETVGQAHELVTQFEGRLRDAVPNLYRVVTHIEPAHLSEHLLADSVDAHDLARRALEIANTLYPSGLWHDLDIRRETDGGYALSVHCVVSGNTPLEEAHRLAEIVETRVRAALPAIHRVTIHTEPPDQM